VSFKRIYMVRLSHYLIKLVLSNGMFEKPK